MLFFSLQFKCLYMGQFSKMLELQNWMDTAFFYSFFFWILILTKGPHITFILYSEYIL